MVFGKSGTYKHIGINNILNKANVVEHSYSKVKLDSFDDTSHAASNSNYPDFRNIWDIWSKETIVLSTMVTLNKLHAYCSMMLIVFWIVTVNHDVLYLILIQEGQKFQAGSLIS